MTGDRFLIYVCLVAAGFVLAVMVGARNGHDLADREQAMLDTCDAIARDDAARCLDECQAGLAIHAAALSTGRTATSSRQACAMSTPIRIHSRSCPHE